MSSLDKRKGARHGGRHSPWAPELDERLKQLWDEGCSASQIGQKLGLSKNSVIGRARRLDLPRRASPIRLAPELKAAILHDAASGVGPCAIARKVGLSRKIIRKVRLAGGVKQCPSCELTKPNDQFRAGVAECRLCEREGQIVAVAAAVPTHAPRPKVMAAPRKRVSKVKHSERRTCQWVIREGSAAKPWVFCDADAKRGTSWCADHYAIVFTPQSRKDAA